MGSSVFTGELLSQEHSVKWGPGSDTSLIGLPLYNSSDPNSFPKTAVFMICSIALELEWTNFVFRGPDYKYFGLSGRRSLASTQLCHCS